jgi:outer membrane protein with beta-barrel domain
VRAALRVLTACAILIACHPAPVWAEWQLTPLVGLTFGADTSLVDLEGGTNKVHWNFGGTVTLIGASPFGVEGIFVYTSGFFHGERVTAFENDRSIAFMGNVVLAAPRGWNQYGLRPFVSGGIGLLQASATDVRGILSFHNNLLGYNVGGGAVGFITERTGLRFDLRYYSNLKPSDESGVSIGRVRLSYWTGSVGVVIRY